MREKIDYKSENPQFKKQADTCIILGTASSLEQTPWNKDEYDYLACQPVMTFPVAQGKRIDCLWEMHPATYWQNEAVMKRINDTGLPVYMMKRTPLIPNSMEFPIKEIQAITNNLLLSRYFTSTIAYMIAWAVWQEYKFIELYGIHMSHEEEQYSIQRNCCEAWLNFGLGRGTNYWIHEASDIMKSSYMYGYEQEKDVILKLMNKKEQMENGKKELERQRRELDENYWQQVGAVKAFHQMVQEFKA